MTGCVWVDSRKAEGFPVGAACSAAGIATTTFYEWVAGYVKGPCARDVDEACLVNEMVRSHRASNGAYGSPTIHAQLRRLGWVVSHKKVERLMRESSIVGVFKPAKVPDTIPADDDFEIPDLLRRRLAPGCPGVAWDAPIPESSPTEQPVETNISAFPISPCDYEYLLCAPGLNSP